MSENVLLYAPLSIGQGDSLEDMTADADATTGDILNGKTAYVKGEKITGTHECATLAEMTADATATAADIVSGKTAYADGNKITGTYKKPTQYSKVTLRGNNELGNQIKFGTGVNFEGLATTKTVSAGATLYIYVNDIYSGSSITITSLS